MLYPFLEYGLYTEQIERYRDAFPPEQIRIWTYEDTKLPGFLGDVFEFLGVDRSFRPDTSRRYLEQRVPRFALIKWLAATTAISGGLGAIIPQPVRSIVRKVLYRPRRAIGMSDPERAVLIDYYRDDIRRLEHLLGRDLSAWLDPRQSQ